MNLNADVMLDNSLAYAMLRGKLSGLAYIADKHPQHLEESLQELLAVASIDAFFRVHQVLHPPVRRLRAVS